MGVMPQEGNCASQAITPRSRIAALDECQTLARIFRDESHRRMGNQFPTILKVQTFPLFVLAVRG